MKLDRGVTGFCDVEAGTWQNLCGEKKQVWWNVHLIKVVCRFRTLIMNVILNTVIKISLILFKFGFA